MVRLSNGRGKPRPYDITLGKWHQLEYLEIKLSYTNSA